MISLSFATWAGLGVKLGLGRLLGVKMTQNIGSGWIGLG